MKKTFKYTSILIISIIVIAIVLVIIKNKINVKVIEASTEYTKSDVEINYYGIKGRIINSQDNPISDVSVMLYKDGEESPISQIITNETGQFIFDTTISNITTGIYQIQVSKTGYLSRKVIDIPVNIEGNQMISIQDIKLNAGDINQDGEIQLRDLICLNDNFSKLELEPTETRRAMDINNDGYINELDREILKDNYGGNSQEIKLENIGYEIIYNLESQVSVGDYVDYQPTEVKVGYELPKNNTGATAKTLEQENLKWRVLNKDQETGKIILIAEEPTVGTLELYGPYGYNNAVYLLDDICKNLYTKDGVGQARSIDMKDIEKYSTYNPSTFARYGTKVTPQSNKIIPKLATYESGVNSKVTDIDGSNDGISVMTMPDNSFGYVTSASYAVFVNVPYTYFKYTNANTYINGIPYELLINKENNKSYWLATRCFSGSYADNGNAVAAIFNVFCVKDGGIDANFLANSNSNNMLGSMSIMPIVELNENLKTSGKDANGVWNIIE